MLNQYILNKKTNATFNCVLLLTISIVFSYIEMQINDNNYKSHKVGMYSHSDQTQVPILARY